MAKGGKREGSGRPKGANLASTVAKRSWGAKILPDKREIADWKKWLDDPRVGFEAFKLAVAYKHGKPVQPVAGPDGGPIPLQVITNVNLPHE
jgi:hypothetical protein